MSKGVIWPMQHDQQACIYTQVRYKYATSTFWLHD